MTILDIVNALALPPESFVNQRIPKKLLVENGAPTAADKRQINEGIEELRWLAILKPTTISVPEYRNDVREYLEIAVLTLILRPDAKLGRLMELIHRAIPYPLLLIAEQSDDLTLSLANKRWSQGEEGKIVLDGKLIVADVGNTLDLGVVNSFSEAIPLTQQSRASIYALYHGWIEAVISLQIANITGIFRRAKSPEHLEMRCDALQEYADLESKIVAMRAAAIKEKQLNRQVELNLEIKRLRTIQAAIITKF